MRQTNPVCIVCGLSFLQPAMTNIQYQNLTLIATALILGSKFNLTEISLMWLKEKVSVRYLNFYQMPNYLPIKCNSFTS